MATLTGKRVKDTYKDLLQVSNSNSGIDATMRVVSDGEATDSVLYLSSAGVAVSSGLNIGAATAVASGKVTQTAVLNAASGAEVAYALGYTVNKAAGDDTGLQITMTDSASPGTSYLLNAIVGSTSLLSLSNAGVVTLAGSIAATKTITSADADGTRHFSFTATSNTDPAASAEVNGGYFAFNKTAGSNGTYIYNALEGVYRSQYADESSTGRGVYGRFYIDPASSATLRTGIGIEASARASYSGGTEIAAESGTAFVGSRIWMAPYFSAATVGNVNNFWGLWIYGEHASQRNADAAIKISDANGGWGELINATNTTGPGFTFTSNLNNASGNEIAYTLNYTTNKNAGDDTGLLIKMTDTVSNGTSLLIDAQVGSSSMFKVDNAGAITVPVVTASVAAALPAKSLIAGTGSSGISLTNGGLALSYGNASYGIYYVGDYWNLSNYHTLAWHADGDVFAGGTSGDTHLQRAGAGILKIMNAATALHGCLELDTNAHYYADTVTLTDNTLTALFDVALADTAMAGGTFHYTIKCVDATPHYQVEQGTVNFMAFNKGAAYTTDFNIASSQILGSGTLATTFSITTGTNLITMNVTSNSSLTPAAFTLTYQLFLNHSGAVTKKT